MAVFMVENIRVNRNILDDEKYNYLFTVEDVNKMVLSGVPFRDAYKEIGCQVQSGVYHPNRELNHTHEGSIGNLCTAQIKAKMDAVYAQIVKA